MSELDFPKKTERGSALIWFRHGLRLHDNPALHEALKDCSQFYAVFIFDGESAGTKLVGYNRMKFLLESLADLNDQLERRGGKLYLLKGTPSTIFKRLHEEVGLAKICFEQDCEPIWKERDNSVKTTCEELGMKCVEKVSHTLWDPKEIIQTNGGKPPLTYQLFIETVPLIGEPRRPVQDVEWTNIKFGILPDHLLDEFEAFSSIPSPEAFGLEPEVKDKSPVVRWIGGETHALHQLTKRLQVEENAFKNGVYLPNQANPDLIGPPTSLSAALRFGCLSVRRFYWEIHDVWMKIRGKDCPPSDSITGQLIWREYFYTMSVDNPFYAEMERNPICLTIPWVDDDENLQKWAKGETGYPFIDASMRQLLLEGWIPHAARNAVACFLTRGDLWISWEKGLSVFLYHLLDADWSVCAGNWMWVSSSAFERLLDCTMCVSPVSYGRRLDPWGTYIKRYVPELSGFPPEYIHEPWKAPIVVQESAGCIIGHDYPERIVDHAVASKRNQKYMEAIRNSLMSDFPAPHCCPSNEDETRHFLMMDDAEIDHVH
ncbi:cryptochrome-1 [Ischnura elegans]|uniref:cryptochrome-1 n=1 Tax=Ischnura elegans TaxID=197161 RepID=UPI001ED8B5B7|nr:cryptochrome-1 [Ischnura elegans]